MHLDVGRGRIATTAAAFSLAITGAEACALYSSGAACRMANAFLVNMASWQGVNVDRALADQIGISLMQADLRARSDANGRELDFKEIRNYHGDVFANHGISIDAWTAYAPIAAFEKNYAGLGFSSAEQAGSAAWRLMTSGETVDMVQLTS